MTITASEIAKLRKTTGAGMMDCKKALQETNGDFEAAIDSLRKKGQKVSAKRADKEANEGVAIALTSNDNKKGIIIEISCETDFVSKNSDFVEFANKIAKTALDNFPENTEELKSVEVDSMKISELLDDQMTKIGEKIELSAYEKVEDEMVIPYIHMGNKIGVLISMNKNNDDVEKLGKDVAMQVAAMNPVALDEDSVDQKIIDKEIEIAKEQIKAEGKAENLVERIAQGKLKKFFKENTLVNQDFVKDSSKTIKEVVAGVDKELKINSFFRVMVGE
ncbi:MAG: translation elongation factor Ts [Bacteroidota bacterium]|nr:translation elongation factor Ts [Bacteroidota bacterium]